jgi:hypothetical protein
VVNIGHVISKYLANLIYRNGQKIDGQLILGDQFLTISDDKAQGT